MDVHELDDAQMVYDEVACGEMDEQLLDVHE